MGLRVAFKTSNGKYLTIPQGDADQIGTAQTVEAILLDDPGPQPPPPPSEAGWWGPDRASLRVWVRAHYLAPNPTDAQIEYWVVEILAHPGDDPNPADNERYWIGKMSA